ncbi:MAG TPA: hypothetical protein VFX96_03205 [Pyrinomonadaceae bacterium]|nr:hypothetical protein [Pyrinomonadaceae bacterium]
MSLQADILEEPTHALPPELTSGEAADAHPSPADEPLDTAGELGIWLRALQSFFELGNHPRADSSEQTVSGRDFACEASVAREALRRCSRLSAVLAGGGAVTNPSLFDDEQRGASVINGAGDSSGDGLFASGDATSDELHEIIGELCALAEALGAAGHASFDVWTSFARIVARQLAVSETAWRLTSASAARHTRSPLWPQLRALTERVTPDALGADVSAIFAKLLGLLELLKHIEGALAEDRPLKQTLPLFTLLREEATALLTMLSERTLRIEGLDASVAEQLDGTAYAVKMELRKAFEHELAGLASLTSAPHIYARVENAHGLLRDCFQQSIVALAQIFDPQLEGARLFGAFKTKLDQSLALRRDLWQVLQSVRGAEAGSDSVSSLGEALQTFCGGSLRNLMYKDWEAYERFAEEVTTTKGAGEQRAVLHRFSAYLETLFGQVNMRAVLADYPFVQPARGE